MVMSYFQRNRTQCKVESVYTTVTQTKNDAYIGDSFFGHCNTVFEGMGCCYQKSPCEEARPFLTGEENQRGIKKRELHELQKPYMQEKCYNVIEMYECGWWKICKTDIVVKQHLRDSFPYK